MPGDGDPTERAIGRIEGEIIGINRELRDIKELLKCRSKDCEECRANIDSRISGLQNKHTGEEAVTHWIDTALGKIALLISMCGGIAGLIVTAWKIGDLLVFGRI